MTVLVENHLVAILILQQEQLVGIVVLAAICLADWSCLTFLGFEWRQRLYLSRDSHLDLASVRFIWLRLSVSGWASLGGDVAGQDGDGGSFASRMMEKMGWKEGLGLGKAHQGITTHLEHQKTDKSVGVIRHAAPRPDGGPPEKKQRGVTFQGTPSRVVLLRNIVGPGERTSPFCWIAPSTLYKLNRTRQEPKYFDIYALSILMQRVHSLQSLYRLTILILCPCCYVSERIRLPRSAVHLLTVLRVFVIALLSIPNHPC